MHKLLKSQKMFPYRAMNGLTESSGAQFTSANETVV